jgi:hypothetical protein
MQEFVIVQPSYPGTRVWAIAVLPPFLRSLLGDYVADPTPAEKNLISGPGTHQCDGQARHECHVTYQCRRFCQHVTSN